MKTEFEDWLTTPLLALTIETDAEHIARVDQRARKLRDTMRDKWLCHPANQVKRLDGRSYAAPAPANVRPMRKREAA